MPYRAMRESLNAVVDSLSDGILVTDKQGNIILYNRKAEAFLGIQGKAALGQPVQNHIGNSVLVSLITNTLALDLPYHTEEVCLIDLSDIRLRVHVNPVRNEDGLLIGSVTLLHDVSRLSAIDNIKANFLSMVSHQLKSPLSSTLLQTSILLDGIVGELNDKQMDLLQKVKNRIKGMVDLIRDILDVCFIEEGGYLKQIEHLDVAEILKRTVELIQPQAQDKNIALHVKIDDNLPVISGNRSSVEALFINLISNAIKYTPPGGKVNVEMGENAQNVQLEVTDTGIGVEDVDFPRIFDKFYRVRSDLTKNISGTGLGLSIVKSVVDAHYGTINIESKVGVGTIFTVLLPAKIEALRGNK
ncbi:MAG: cell wall metabolism sensor histidine kinase WalK [Thermodesulfovibrionales bacterium]|nr:cell wall metabolism sensor histidine kinase WalK [Thermodesulfovibrionales bacterium]